jgi:hypothetical protein
MTIADRIRLHAKQRYLIPARVRNEQRVSIRAGDVVREMDLGGGRAPAVCSALKAQKFLDENGLRLVSKTGPESGQSTSVTYTYEFPQTLTNADRLAAWNRLRGALKDVYAEYGGGEAYLRAERASFRDETEPE